MERWKSQKLTKEMFDNNMFAITGFAVAKCQMFRVSTGRDESFVVKSCFLRWVNLRLLARKREEQIRMPSLLKRKINLTSARASQK